MKGNSQIIDKIVISYGKSKRVLYSYSALVLIKDRTLKINIFVCSSFTTFTLIKLLYFSM